MFTLLLIRPISHFFFAFKLFLSFLLLLLKVSRQEFFATIYNLKKKLNVIKELIFLLDTY